MTYREPGISWIHFDPINESASNDDNMIKNVNEEKKMREVILY